EDWATTIEVLADAGMIEPGGAHETYVDTGFTPAGCTASNTPSSDGADRQGSPPLSTSTIPPRRAHRAPSNPPAVSARDTSVTFSSQRGTVTALSGANLEVEQGEFVTIVGPSGCGKSTLLKLVSGLGGYSSGTVEINGDPISGPRQDIGFVFQRPALLE